MAVGSKQSGRRVVDDCAGRPFAAARRKRRRAACLLAQDDEDDEPDEPDDDFGVSSWRVSSTLSLTRFWITS